MKGLTRLTVFVAAVALLAPFATFSDAQAKHKFLISHAVPDHDPFHLGYLDMKKFLEEKGDFEVTIYSNREFSANEPEALQQTMDGVIQMCQGPTYLLATTTGVKGLFVYDYPGLMTSIDEFHKVARSDLAKEWAAEVKKKTGLIVGRAWVNGRSAIGSSLHSIKNLDDVKGQKMRSPTSDITVPWLQLLGINPIPMAFAEIYTGLQQKTIDGVYTPLRFFWTDSYADIAKYILWDQFFYIMQVPMVNGDYYNALPEDQRKILDAAVEYYVDQVHKYTMDFEQKSLEEIKKKGGEVNMIDEATRVRMQELADKLLVDKADVAGKDTIERVRQILGKK